MMIKFNKDSRGEKKDLGKSCVDKSQKFRKRMFFLKSYMLFNNIDVKR